MIVAPTFTYVMSLFLQPAIIMIAATVLALFLLLTATTTVLACKVATQVVDTPRFHNATTFAAAEKDQTVNQINSCLLEPTDAQFNEDFATADLFGSKSDTGFSLQELLLDENVTWDFHGVIINLVDNDFILSTGWSVAVETEFPNGSIQVIDCVELALATESCNQGKFEEEWVLNENVTWDFHGVIINLVDGDFIHSTGWSVAVDIEFPSSCIQVLDSLEVTSTEPCNEANAPIKKEEKPLFVGPDFEGYREPQQEDCDTDEESSIGENIDNDDHEHYELLENGVPAVIFVKVKQQEKPHPFLSNFHEYREPKTDFDEDEPQAPKDNDFDAQMDDLLSSFSKMSLKDNSNKKKNAVSESEMADLLASFANF